MSTLERIRPQEDENEAPSALASSVPRPFTQEDRERIRQYSHQVRDDPTTSTNATRVQDASLPQPLQESVMPSIAAVQKSCIMTLNNLLSVPVGWQPIVPDRRHSMPSTPSGVRPSSSADSYKSSALQTLVTNLRNQDHEFDLPSSSAAAASTTSQTNSDSVLIAELQDRIERIAPSLSPSDSKLVHGLVSLLLHFNSLSVLSASEYTFPNNSQLLEAPSEPGSGNPFDTLKRHLSDLQVARTEDTITRSSAATPVQAVQDALLWTRIDEELESVLNLCRQVTHTEPHQHLHLPPEYEEDVPPQYEYDDEDFGSIEDYKKGPPGLESYNANTTTTTTTDEKMRLDLEAVTLAIDRLYLVAPQLHNQRVELHASKRAQMERARASTSTSSGKGKEHDKDVRDLENIINLIGRASDRKMVDQAVVLEGGMQARLEKARQRDLKKREEFVNHLAQHSASGRLHSQDAVLPTHPRPLREREKEKDPETLLTLPEFIRESLHMAPPLDPDAVVAFPDFIREPVPAQAAVARIKTEEAREASSASGDATSSNMEGKTGRNRSLSAPSISSWFRSSSSPSSALASSSKAQVKQPPLKSSLEVSYVAENHSNLQHVIVVMDVQGRTAGVDLVAEVISSSTPPSSAATANNKGKSKQSASSTSNTNTKVKSTEHIFIRCGDVVSPPLALPGRVSPGVKDIKVHGTHYEVKLTTLRSPSGQAIDAEDEHDQPLMDATQLSALAPTTFICASCSLPLVHTHGGQGKVAQQDQQPYRYRDLPSEHWEELVDAWMCHSDQKLHEQIAKRASGAGAGGRRSVPGGFWPERGEALVGGSYLLFKQHAIVRANLLTAEESKNGGDWKLARCLCGHIAGRCQDFIDESGGATTTVFKFAKYAIRPVSPTAEPLRILLSAFVVEDMLEFVRAHATYRFVVLDEEEEKPRILMWLFKPSIRISYATPKQYMLPRSGTIRVAKVLYKLLGPSPASHDLTKILNQYPGFPQAEYLFYPMGVCRRLAALLKESNSSYPEGMRTMTGLDVGWLPRA